MRLFRLVRQLQVLCLQAVGVFRENQTRDLHVANAQARWLARPRAFLYVRVGWHSSRTLLHPMWNSNRNAFEVSLHDRQRGIPEATIDKSHPQTVSEEGNPGLLAENRASAVAEKDVAFAYAALLADQRHSAAGWNGKRRVSLRPRRHR